jgi:hypothetical protein
VKKTSQQREQCKARIKTLRLRLRVNKKPVFIGLKLPKEAGFLWEKSALNSIMTTWQTKLATTKNQSLIEPFLV